LKYHNSSKYRTKFIDKQEEFSELLRHFVNTKISAKQKLGEYIFIPYVRH